MPPLPLPDDVTLAVSHQLHHTISQEIDRQNGKITFAKFMDMALYFPGLGYYSAGAHKFGVSGDFITAPDISPLFAQCLAAQIAPLITDHSLSVLWEIGAGSGRLAVDLLNHLALQNALPESYWILEVSADLRQRQHALLQQHCPQWLHKIKWLTQLPENPVNGIILANEVVDALPVHLFEINTDGVQERYVGHGPEGFYFVLGPLSHPRLNQYLNLFVKQNTPLALPYRSEISLAAMDWLAGISAHLHQGILFLVDYGFPAHEYYHPQRNQGTLMCHYRHHNHADPFHLVGGQDITSHVNFTALSHQAQELGLALQGFTNQASFLINNGLEKFATPGLLGDTQQRLTTAHAIKKLTLPSEMGELFKVIAFSREMAVKLAGFSRFDYRHKL